MQWKSIGNANEIHKNPIRIIQKPIKNHNKILSESFQNPNRILSESNQNLTNILRQSLSECIDSSDSLGTQCIDSSKTRLPQAGKTKISVVLYIKLKTDIDAMEINRKC